MTDKMKVINILNVPDYKKPNGEWGKFYTEYGEDGVRLQNHTRSSILWNNLQSRCRKGSAHQQNNAAYTVCENNFESYNAFAERCQDEDGYLEKNSNGTYWCLDKDVLVHSNTVYSPETCLFIPQSVNNLLVASDSARGDFPVGVSKHVQGNCIRYIAYCRSNNQRNYLGVFFTPNEAHKAWQKAKIICILEAANSYKEHKKLTAALLENAARIEDDYKNDRETKIAWWSRSSQK